MGEQTHRSDPRVLGARTLERDHRGLLKYLRPGMAVLDVGCGTGSITSGIAGQVGPRGRVVGLDRDESLLEVGRAEHGGRGNLEFVCGDALRMEYCEEFDVVTASRALQWIAESGEAIRRMAQACKRGGWVVALDYIHEDHSWRPEPPREFRRFYEAFLEWRTASGWENRIGDKLAAQFGEAGLQQIRLIESDEETRGRPEPIWQVVIETIGPKIVESGFLTEAEREATATAYREYVDNELQAMTLRLRTVAGRKD